MPGGQRAPWHAYPQTRENLFLCVAAEVEFSAGSSVFPLKPFDMLFCRGVPYRYQNPDSADTLFWVLTKKRQGATQASATGQGTTYYDTEPAGEPVAMNRMRIVRWEAYRRDFQWDHAESDTWGSRRCTYPDLNWLGVRGRIVKIPPAHTGVTNLATDAVVVGLSGKMDFQVGSVTYQVGALDALAVSPNILLEYVNGGMCDALLFEMTPDP
jgi:quercetin dioxygenase-like cupin family protein